MTELVSAVRDVPSTVLALIERWRDLPRPCTLIGMSAPISESPGLAHTLGRRATEPRLAVDITDAQAGLKVVTGRIRDSKATLTLQSSPNVSIQRLALPLIDVSHRRLFGR